MTAWSVEHGADARAALHAIVSDPEHGPDALSDPRTMSNLLQDLLPDAVREAGLLVAAASAGVPGSLREHMSQGMDARTAVSLAASALATRTAFTSEACEWVSAELAVALGLMPAGAVRVTSPRAERTQAAVITADPRTEAAGDAGVRSAAPERAVPAVPAGLESSGPGANSARPRRIAPVVLAATCVLAAACVVLATVIILRSGPGASATNAGNSPGPGVGTPGSPATTPSWSNTGALDPHTPGSMTSVAWAPGGTVVATGDKDGSVYLWDAATGRQRRQLMVPGAGEVLAAAISPGGTVLAAGYSNGSTYLFSVATGRPVATLADPGPAAGKEVDSLAFSPDGGTLVTADGNGSAYVWRITAGPQASAPAMTLSDPAGVGVWSAAFSSRGKLATGDYSGHIYLWDLGSGSPSGPLVIPGGLAVTALAFSPDGSTLAAGSGSLAADFGSLYLFDVSSQAGQFIDSAGSIWALSYTGTTLAMATGNGKSYLWNVSTASGKATAAGTLPDPASGVKGVGALGFSPDGKWLVTGDTNGVAYVWKSG